MEKRINKTIYKNIDIERITAALDNDNRYDANVIFKYSALTQQEFDEIIAGHPNSKDKERMYTEFWRKVLDRLVHEVAKPSFDTWLRNTDGVKSDQTIHVYCENDFQMDWLENQYEQLIQKTGSEIAGEDVQVRFQLKTVR